MDDELALSLYNIEPDELAELVQLVKQVHGFDFSQYSKASFKRRVIRVMQLKRLRFYDLKHRLINDEAFFNEFLKEITVNVTEMFRDPQFFKAMNEHVLPYISSYQNIKIWSAGCSTGEEVYSLAILLQMNNLLSKSFIYGTDVNTQVISDARKGIYNLRKVKQYAENYLTTGLGGSLTDHFTLMYEAATIQQVYKQQTLFSVHNLISDQVFNEFQVITCRNVFIYFESQLQEKILDLFYRSLCPLGFLCLGSKEAIRSDTFSKKFKVINKKENIYQKVGV